jgi:dihydrofolate reductase
MRVALVAAVAENGVIGNDGDIPWHLPADLARFKETTVGHPVIMGRLTYESIAERLGGPLPDRTNVVLSRGDPDLPEGVVHAPSPAAALDAAESTDSEMAYVIGGESVYRAFLPDADRLVLTEVHDSYEGDTRFPEFGPQWVEVEREEHEAFDFVTYERA